MKTKLTGRVAYRFHKQLFRKPVLVLQVEVEKKAEVADAYDEYPTHDRVYWRDADHTDLAELNYTPTLFQEAPYKDGGLVPSR